MGFVKNGRDIDGILTSLHGQALLAGLIGSLSWLANPLIKNPLLKNFLLSRKGDKTGTGKLMEKPGTRDHSDRIAVLRHQI